MFVKRLEGGGEIRARLFGHGWTLETINENGKGVALGVTNEEGAEIARLLLYEDESGFEHEDTGVIDVSNIDGEQHEKEDTDED